MYYSGNKKKLRAGDLRHRVTIKTPGMVENEAGEEVPGYVEFKKAWASIKPITGREYQENEKDSNEITHRIRIRYTTGLTEKMRIVFGIRKFDIESIINVEELNRELLIKCIEKR